MDNQNKQRRGRVTLKQITILILCLITFQMAHGQVGKSEVRQALSALQSETGNAEQHLVVITNGLIQASLNKRLTKKSEQTIGLYYKSAITNSDTRLSSLRFSIESDQLPYAKYVASCEALMLVATRIALTDNLKSLELGLIILDDTDSLTRIRDQLIRQNLAFKKESADYFFVQGMSFFEKPNPTKTDYQRAYTNFVDCIALIPNYQNVQRLMADALTRGTLHVQFSIVSETDAPSNMARDAINRVLMAEFENKTAQFICFDVYNHQQPDVKVIIELSKINLFFEKAEPYVKKRESTIKNAQGNPVTVKATVTINRKMASCRFTLTMRFVNPEGKEILVGQVMTPSFEWFNEWRTFTGNKQALTKSDRIWIEKSELKMPTEQQMVESAVLDFEDHAFNIITRKLKQIIITDYQVAAP